MRICLSAQNTLRYPGGGHLWVFLNWALGFESLGHEVYWLEVVDPRDDHEKNARLLQFLQDRLAPFGLDKRVALCTPDGEPYGRQAELPLVPLEEVFSAEVLCDLNYNLAKKIVDRFRRSMLLDMDPGQLQVALDYGKYNLAPHHTYFTVGEWPKFMHKHKPPFNTRGIEWLHTPPPVALDHWPVTPAPPGGPVTTVSHWYNVKDGYMPDADGTWYDNSKQAAFEDYLTLPQLTPLPMELCLNTGSDQPEIDRLRGYGWRVIESNGETNGPNHPQGYRRYIRNSLAEFSCAKPSYVRMNTGWLSDRTACYLASGRPVVVQKTGESDLFPDDVGMLRFTDFESATRALDALCHGYERHSRAARAIAEEHLDAKKVLTRVLEHTV